MPTDFTTQNVSPAKLPPVLASIPLSPAPPAPNKPAPLSLNKPKLDNLAGDIWKSAERLRGKFKAYEYQGVILPIIVIRRLECVLLKWREDKKTEIRARNPKITDAALDTLVKKLELNRQQSPFYNKT